MPLVLGGVVAAVIAILIVLRRRSGRDDSGVLSAAHTERMLRMPEYKSAYRRALLKLGAMFLLVLVSLGAFSIVAARPITTDVADTDRVNRDIVLCLDVSGSMTAADAAIVERFLELVEQFHGERIALVVWDSSAAQVFPLNDDYDYVEEQLASIADETSTDVGDVGDVFGGDPDGIPADLGGHGSRQRVVEHRRRAGILRPPLRPPRARPVANDHPGDRQPARRDPDRHPRGGDLVRARA